MEPSSPIFSSHVGEIFCESDKTCVKIFRPRRGASKVEKQSFRCFSDLWDVCVLFVYTMWKVFPIGHCRIPSFYVSSNLYCLHWNTFSPVCADICIVCMYSGTVLKLLGRSQWLLIRWQLWLYSCKIFSLKFCLVFGRVRQILWCIFEIIYFLPCTDLK